MFTLLHLRTRASFDRPSRSGEAVSSVTVAITILLLEEGPLADRREDEVFDFLSLRLLGLAFIRLVVQLVSMCRMILVGGRGPI